MSISHGAMAKVCYVTHDIERAIQHWAEGVRAGPFYILTSAPILGSAAIAARQPRTASRPRSVSLATP